MSEYSYLFDGLSRLASYIVFNSKAKKSKRIDAIVAIQEAVNSTRIHINENCQKEYQPSSESSKLWLIAFEKCQLLSLNDVEIKQCITKARFWSDPEEWKKYESAMELIPSLIEMENLADTMLEKLNSNY